MGKNEWMIGIVGLLLGIVLTVGYGGYYYTRHHAGMGTSDMMKMMSNKTQNEVMMRGEGMMGSGSTMSMDNMMSTLKGKTGDAFDKEFIANMIVHHEGAVDMANEAKKSAKHQEIKTLSDAIIVAQTNEITDMKSWYKSWYGVEVEDEHNIHHQ